ncbi:MAG: hypothetical protein WEE03_04450 [Chloroflexota bacterium]
MRADPRAQQGLWPLFVALAAAGLIELAFFRVAYRVGLFVPRDGPLVDAYGVITYMGSLAFDLVSVIGLIALAGLAVESWRARTTAKTAALAAFLALAATLPFVPASVSDVARALFSTAAVLAVAIIVAPALVDRASGAANKLALLLVALALVAAQYGAAVSGGASAFGATGEPAFALAGVRIAEIAAVAAAFPLAISALAARRIDRSRAVVAFAATATAASAIVTQPYLTGILLLWAAGLSLLLPLPAYAAAFAAYILAVATEAASTGRAHRAIGAILLIVAGVVPQSSAHVVVAILALALLARPRALGPSAGTG